MRPPSSYTTAAFMNGVGPAPMYASGWDRKLRRVGQDSGFGCTVTPCQKAMRSRTISASDLGSG